ncbi:hypothetical protein AMAG_15173 [Allomyces macrogynus ATCC 38327]|uniref:DNA/RNA-binding domain-containing protein n=1 Tax=Allomyces macrogynus (strain ATCC 38327) TaxID=578462 RepID=A0A0L0T626_ALLM3|nr:hypothetical protein AMAG_15173 [Allomyces macrogynus ATCC 38327]|eukprot:KNE70205.1 hypothetical protein AMAG_15173 [Allomyces macrogynus ATCC 38327]
MTAPPPPGDSIQAQLEASLFGALEGDPALAPAPPAPAAPALPAPPVSPRTAASPFQPFFLVPSSTTARATPLLHPSAAANSARALDALVGAAPVHYLRAYALAPDDAMLNLTLGVAYLHRAMQRKSDNRHQQVAQGIAFLLRFAEISLAPPAPAAAGEPSDNGVPPVFRQPRTLVLYNLGRAFHQIGLVALATRYYRMALDDKSAPQFHREAAYNLALVYTHSNAPRLAKQVMREHLTF